MHITCPDTHKAGSSLTLETPSGNMAVIIPDGIQPGQSFQVQVPAQAAVVLAGVVAPVVQAVAQPVVVQSVVAQPVAVPVAAAVHAVSGEASSHPSSQGFHYSRTVPAVVKCVHCGKEGLTTIRYETGVGTFLICVGCVMVGCFMGCCLVPFGDHNCKDGHHQCSGCGAKVGVRKVI